MDVPAELIPWLELLLKMALTAAVVVAASLVAERSGPFLGAMIASLPTAAGAAYVILALEHPPAFIASSAVGSVAAMATVAVFALAYAWLARGHGLLLSLGTALVIWLVSAVALRAVNWTLWSAGLLNIVVFSATTTLSARLRQPDLKPPKMKTQASDIALRAASTAVVVAAVTEVSDHIGPFFAGVFALFPVVMGSLAAILHLRIGGPASANVLANVQAPVFGLAISFGVVSVLVIPLGVWWALLAGLAVCLAWNALLLRWNRTPRPSQVTDVNPA